MEVNNTRPRLRVDNLSVFFDGLHAVADLSLSIPARCIVALIGPNGAGKTTLFNLICGYLPVNSGSIAVDNVEVTKKRPERIAQLGVGRSFQDCKVFEQMSVLDNVLLGMRDSKSETISSAILQRQSLRKGQENRLELAIKLLRETGLESKSSSLACDLSYGQRKLLELCRVRAFKPLIYLLDEPFSGLFPDTATAMAKIIQGLREEGKAVVFIEHDMQAVANISDRVVVLDFGRKIADGAPDEVLNDPVVLDTYLRRVTHDAT